MVVPQSGRVRELSDGERRIRERSGRSSASGSQVSRSGKAVLYLIPESKKFINDELLRICSSRDKVQVYYLN